MSSSKKPIETSTSNLKFELKEILTIITVLISLLATYFGIIKDIETRLVKIETRLDIMDKDFYTQPSDSIRRDELPEKPIEQK